MSVDHKYSLELDVIAQAGAEALKKFGEKGNIVFIDFDEIGRISKLENDSRSESFQDVLKYLNDPEKGTYDLISNGVRLNAGGLLSWDKPDDISDVQYITRCPARTSELRRRGKHVDFPKFLVYGPECLKQGFRDIESCAPDLNKFTIDELVKVVDEETLRNNQFFRINRSDGLIYQLKYDLISNNAETKFKIDETKDPRLIRVNASENSCKVPGFEPRNVEQVLALKNLIADDVEVHVISGGSGSGKSVVAYVAALHSILGNEKLRKAGDIKKCIRLFMANDIIGGSSRYEGFLKGSSFEKGWPFMKSYKDAHNCCGLNQYISFEEMLAPPKESIVFDDNPAMKIIRKRDRLGDSQYLPANSPAIEVENLAYCRGRTFEDEVIFVDEGQNYTPFEIKQLIERAGAGSIIYIVGDYKQVDNPRLSPNFNGLVYAANSFYDAFPRFSVMHFDRNYRSQAAEYMRGIKAPRD